MRKFNIVEFESNEVTPVVTIFGCDVLIFKVDMSSEYPINFVVYNNNDYEDIFVAKLDGTSYSRRIHVRSSSFDLMFKDDNAKTLRKAFVNIYKSKDYGQEMLSPYVMTTEEEADYEKKQVEDANEKHSNNASIWQARGILTWVEDITIDGLMGENSDTHQMKEEVEE